MNRNNNRPYGNHARFQNFRRNVKGTKNKKFQPKNRDQAQEISAEEKRIIEMSQLYNQVTIRPLEAATVLNAPRRIQFAPFLVDQWTSQMLHVRQKWTDQGSQTKALNEYQSVRVDLSEAVRLIKANFENVRAKPAFWTSPKVAAALLPLKGPTPCSNNQDVVGKDADRLIYIGEEILLSISNGDFDQFIRFHNRFHFIVHHLRHYFSNQYLPKNALLKSFLSKYSGTCPFHVLLTFNRLAAVETTVKDLVNAAEYVNGITLAYCPYSKIPVGFKVQRWN